MHHKKYVLLAGFFTLNILAMERCAEYNAKQNAKQNELAAINRKFINKIAMYNDNEKRDLMSHFYTLFGQRFAQYHDATLALQHMHHANLHQLIPNTHLYSRANIGICMQDLKTIIVSEIGEFRTP